MNKGALIKSAPERIAAEIRRGRWPTDEEFDCCLQRELQEISVYYWSQLAVAACAARWLKQLGVETVVDIGSGAGKFCVAAALATRCRFVGVEQRTRLVLAADALAAAFGVSDRVRFERGTFGEDPTPTADVYYFYNPFGENLFPYEDRLDLEVELSSDRYVEHVSAAEELLRRAPVGTYLLTYNGFGGRVPTSYAPIMGERRLPCVLRMWQKTSELEHGIGELACAEPGIVLCTSEERSNF
jgi:hypothetical protein